VGGVVGGVFVGDGGWGGGYFVVGRVVFGCGWGGGWSQIINLVSIASKEKYSSNQSSGRTQNSIKIHSGEKI